jgi:hypothetical protein
MDEDEQSAIAALTAASREMQHADRQLEAFAGSGANQRRSPRECRPTARAAPRGAARARERPVRRGRSCPSGVANRRA